MRGVKTMNFTLIQGAADAYVDLEVDNPMKGVGGIKLKRLFGGWRQDFLMVWPSPCVGQFRMVRGGGLTALIADARLIAEQEITVHTTLGLTKPEYYDHVFVDDYFVFDPVFTFQIDSDFTLQANIFNGWLEYEEVTGLTDTQEVQTLYL